MSEDPTRSIESVIAAKVKWRVLPLLMASWLIAYIDRFNVSFAALQMNAELGFTTTMFGFGAGLFFIGYALFEVPSNVALTRFGARKWLARIMITWGLITVGQTWVEGPLTFYGLRFLLGVAEAGCFPGMAFYLSRWLAPRERTAALAGLGSMAMLSGIVGAPIAAALLALDGVAGLAGWQWLFLVEGVPAVVLGLLVLRYLPEGPESAAWLTQDERRWLATNLSTATEAAQPALQNLRLIMSDRRYWVWGTAFFCTAAAGSASTLLRPILIRQMAGLDNITTAALSALPAIVGVAAMVYIGRHSTRMDERRWHSAVPALISAVGLILSGWVYGLVGVLTVAAISTVGGAFQPPLFGMVSSAATGARNAVGIAFVNSVAAVGSFAGPYLLGYLVDRTGGFVVSHGIAGLLMVAGACLVLLVKDRRPAASPGDVVVGV